jgi:hypothetical protein
MPQLFQTSFPPRNLLNRTGRDTSRLLEVKAADGVDATGIVASLSAAGGLVRHFGGAALESRSLFTAETIGNARKPAYSPPGDISVDCPPVHN